MLAQHVGKNQRMSIDEFELPIAIESKTLFHDAALEQLEFILFSFRITVAVHRPTGPLAMKVMVVRRIYRILHWLKPIAVQRGQYDDSAFSVGSCKHIISWQQGHRLRSHVGENQSG